jgi:hypothetical protein|tara:strand:+ start:2061 stop:2801 length:741 start_codon:yes stop_codon:yes gene_type:complete
MSLETVSINQVVNDYMLTMGYDDYSSNASEVVVRNFALRGIRELGFDMGLRLKASEISVDQTTGTVALPADFVGLLKLGVIGSDGLIYQFIENSNINLISTRGRDAIPNYSAFDSEVYRNYISTGSQGGLYGMGGGKGAGEYRINYDQNRIELSTSVGSTTVAIEYVADEALSESPTVHKFAEEALRAYMYYKIVERKSNVPGNEKARARQEYYNERRKANSRMKSFGKVDALAMIRKNFRQSPKY